MMLLLMFDGGHDFDDLGVLVCMLCRQDDDIEVYGGGQDPDPLVTR